jgi:acyl-CoA reductase-like NAD-dependent aldehyde dehydrogenase
VVAAIAADCRVIVISAEDTPLSSLRFVQLLLDTDLLSGCDTVI